MIINVENEKSFVRERKKRTIAYNLRTNRNTISIEHLQELAKIAHALKGFVHGAKYIFCHTLKCYEIEHKKEVHRNRCVN